jgi:TPR repeat protein
MTRNNKLIVGVVGVLVALGLSAWWFARMQQEAANVDTAVVEFKKGNYASAAIQLAPYARHGNKTAQLTLGIMYAFGDGVARDRKKAVDLLSQANQGLPDMYLWIAQSFEKGDGVVKDDSEARAWYSLAAEAGSADAKKIVGSW